MQFFNFIYSIRCSELLWSTYLFSQVETRFAQSQLLFIIIWLKIRSNVKCRPLRSSASIVRSIIRSIKHFSPKITKSGRELTHNHQPNFLFWTFSPEKAYLFSHLERIYQLFKAEDQQNPNQKNNFFIGLSDYWEWLMGP